MRSDFDKFKIDNQKIKLIVFDWEIESSSFVN